jgi:hypothetical protein
LVNEAAQDRDLRKTSPNGLRVRQAVAAFFPTGAKTVTRLHRQL